VNKTINAFGFEVDVTYDLVEGRVMVRKTSVRNAGNIAALTGMDITSVAREVIEAEMKEDDELFSPKDGDEEGYPF